MQTVTFTSWSYGKMPSELELEEIARLVKAGLINQAYVKMVRLTDTNEILIKVNDAIIRATGRSVL